MRRFNINQLPTSSYSITGSFTGSFTGDGSQLTGIVSSKWSGSNPITRNSDVEITGSLFISGDTSIDDIFLIRSGSTDYFKVNNNGAVTLQSNANNMLLIKDLSGNTILNVSQSGILVMATQSQELTTTAPNGGIYFTSSSFFIGLDD